MEVYEVGGASLGGRSKPESKGGEEAQISLVFIRDGKEGAPITAQYG